MTLWFADDLSQALFCKPVMTAKASAFRFPSISSITPLRSKSFNLYANDAFSVSAIVELDSQYAGFTCIIDSHRLEESQNGHIKGRGRGEEKEAKYLERIRDCVVQPALS